MKYTFHLKVSTWTTFFNSRQVTLQHKIYTYYFLRIVLIRVNRKINFKNYNILLCYHPDTTVSVKREQKHTQNSEFVQEIVPNATTRKSRHEICSVETDDKKTGHDAYTCLIMHATVLGWIQVQGLKTTTHACVRARENARVIFCLHTKPSQWTSHTQGIYNMLYVHIHELGIYLPTYTVYTSGLYGYADVRNNVG